MVWVQAGGFALLAALAVMRSAPDRYVADNRYDQYHAPGHRLVRMLALWDPSRGLGATREDLWPAQVVPLAALRGLGFDAVTTQRAWHIALLVVASVGAATLLRALRALRPIGPVSPDQGPATSPLAPFLAGLVYGFGPYSLTFFLPTNLYIAYALAPWVVLAAIRGPVSARPWRWAAIAALLVGSLGNTDLPGVVMALGAVPLVAVWSSVRAGRGWRPGAAWLARAGVLGLAVSAATLWKTLAGASVLAQRVNSTEAPETVGVASSWAESLRGLGFWLSYFRGPDLARPQGVDLFSEPVVVVATFVPVLLALGALLLPEVRGRSLWALCLVVGGATMVGLHPIEQPVPLGRALDAAFGLSGTIAGFRSTYKGGAVLVLGTAVLAALGTEAMAARLRRSGHRRGCVAFRVMAVGGVLLAGLPMWTGDLYDPEATSGPIPDYWHDAARTINALPGDGRVLVLPASTRAIYRWGYVGDDVLDSLIVRPQAIDVTIPLSTPEAADLLAAASAAVDDARYRPGTLAPILRRLGIDHVLIRNDLDSETRTLVPNRLSGLRFDPDLERIGEFGSADPDRTVTATSSGRTSDPGDLPLLELYAVIDPGPTGPRLAPLDGPLVVSGSGAALPALAADGYLDDAGAVRYSPDLDAEEVDAALDDGGRLVLSDTNRRRVTVVNSLVRDESWTLAADEDLDRPGSALFDRAGSQTVAWYRDATRISSSGFPRTNNGSQPWTRPAMAFDGDLGTAWQTTELDDQEGIVLRVELRRPERIRRVRIQPVAPGAGARRVESVVLRFADGTERRVRLDPEGTEVAVDAGPGSWVEIEIASVTDGPVGPVGLRQVELGSLDLAEWIRMPDDLIRNQDDADESLGRELAEAPLTLTMARDFPEAPLDVEPLMRRRFRLGSGRRFDLRGELVPTDGTEVNLIRELRGGCGSGVLEVDGEPVPVTVASDAEVSLAVPVEVRSCERLELQDGWHRLEVDPASSLDRIRLDDGRREEATDPGDRVIVRGQRPEDMRLSIDAPDGGVLLTGESHDERWEASVDGRSLGPAEPYDTQSGWRLPAGEDLDVRLVFRPARTYRFAQWITIAAVAGCVALVVGRRRGEVTAPER